MEINVKRDDPASRTILLRLDLPVKTNELLQSSQTVGGDRKVGRKDLASG